MLPNPPSEEEREQYGLPPEGWVQGPFQQVPIPYFRSNSLPSYLEGLSGQGPVSQYNNAGGEPIINQMAQDTINTAHPYELPQDWDYRTSEIGPQGESLPNGAIGWDPEGRPYYGRGLGGYLRGAWARLTAPFEAPRSWDDRPSYAELAARLGTPEEGALQTNIATVALTAQIAAQRASNSPGVLGYISRGANELVRGAMALFQAPAIAAERYWIGPAQGLAAAAGEEGFAVGQDWAFGLVNAESLGWFTRFLATAHPLAMGYNAVKVAQSGRSWDEVKGLLGDATEAGRIAYSAFVEPAVRQEYLRRFRSGEDPLLLAMEIQNPTAELVGQLVIDPLWFVGVGARGARNAGRISSAEREFVAAASDDVANALGRVGRAGADGAAADDVARLVQARMASVASRRAGLARQARDLGITALTTTGKRSAVSRRVGDLFSWMAHNVGKNPDETLEIARGLALTASDNADEVAAGVSILMNTPSPRPFFSLAGEELAIILRDGLGDASKFLDELGDTRTVEAVLELATRRTASVIDRMFPTVAERIAAGEEVSGFVRALTRFDAVAQKKIYQPINRFFANLYMGMSPGYAFRNAIQNSLHVYADYGPRAAAASVGAAVRQLFRPGAFVDAAKDTVARWLGGMVPEGLQRGMTSPAMAAGIAGRRGVGSTFLRVAERMEQGASSVAVRHTVEQTMRRMLRPGRALPDIAPLLEAGLSRQACDHLMALVLDNYGDVGKAAEAFRAALGTGQLETWRTLSAILPDEDIGFLAKIGVDGEVARVLQEAVSPNDVRAGLDEILGEIENQAAKVAGDHSGVADDATHIADSLAIGEARADGVLDDAFVAVTQDRYQAMDNALNAYEDGVRNLQRRALLEAGAQGRVDEAQQIIGRYRFLDRIRDTARTRSRQFVESVISWRDKIAAMDRATTDWAQVWRNIGIPGEPPAIIDYAVVRRALWEQHFYPHQQQFWAEVRTALASGGEAEASELAMLTGIDPNLYLGQAREALGQSQLWDSAGLVGGRPQSLGLGVGALSPNEASIRLIAQRHGIPSAGPDGRIIAGSDQHILNAVNKYLPEGAPRYETLADVPLNVAETSFRARAGVEEVAEAIPTIPLTPQLTPGQIPSFSRVLAENLDGIRATFNDIANMALDAAKHPRAVFTDPGIEAALGRWTTQATPRVNEARLIAGQVGNAARDFTLLNYQGKRYLDLALAYIYPYHFWYTRTYANWLQRLVMNPEVIAGYAKYRAYLESIHAGAPDWYKYQINSNELLGLDSDNPLFFNLEQTLNPLQGLTGVDFNDRYKRVNWWTAALDDLSKFGPSTWTPFSILTAFALHAQGEEDAAARWAGRLIPQTATLQAATALMGVEGGVGLQLDPSVAYFSGGIDPYERRRVGRALGAMVEEGVTTPEQALDAAHVQTGDLWQQARARAINERAPGQLSSFFLGAGFRARTISDITIDRMYTDYFRLQLQRDNLSPNEFREAMDDLRARYPFMDTVLLSRPYDSADRDASYAYNVLSRIPPAQQDDYAEWAGIPGDLIGNFYDAKGNMSAWPEQTRDQFMGAILDLGAILALPPTATRQEWTRARNMYADISGQAESLFGTDIWDRVDAYYGVRDDTQVGRDAAAALLAADPDIGRALDYRSQQVYGNPLLAEYYGSIGQLEAYWRGVMYDAIERECGSDVWDTWDMYTQAKVLGTGRRFWNEHPELERYTAIRDAWEPFIAQQLVDFAERVPDRPSTMLREDIYGMTYGGQAIMAGREEFAGETLPMMSAADWAPILGPALTPLIDDYANGEDLPYAAETALARIAEGMGMETATLMELLKRAFAIR